MSQMARAVQCAGARRTEAYVHWKEYASAQAIMAGEKAKAAGEGVGKNLTQ